MLIKQLMTSLSGPFQIFDGDKKKNLYLSLIIRHYETAKTFKMAPNNAIVNG